VDRQTGRAVGVSRDRQRLRRLLSCLPASKPDFRFILSVPLSVESPFLSFSTLASQSRLPSLSRQNPRYAGRFSISPGRSKTVPPSFARIEATPSRPREPDCSSHTILFLRSLRSSLVRSFDTRALFLRSLRSLASTHEHSFYEAFIRSLRTTSPPLSANLTAVKTPPLRVTSPL